ncbi:hypothetical protein AHAS_Ahas18G0130400 [Arachis hypogaea]
MTDPYQVNPDDGKDVEAELTKIPDKGEEEEDMNFYGDTQIVMRQPAIFRPYDQSDHFFTLNLNAMTSNYFFSHQGLKEDLVSKFEIG